MKSVLVYYPFQLADEINSGSKLRPHEMKSAFEIWGKGHAVETIVISGTSEQREQQFQEYMEKGMLENIWFCYMENQTIPLWLTDPGHIPKRPFIDKKILSFLKKKNVPVGVFYRDVYWKFDDIYPLKGIRRRVMQTIYRLEENFYEKYCNVIFLPSNEMGEYVAINRPKTDLPPGGRIARIPLKAKHDGPYEAIYVGAITGEDYGLSLLLDSFELVNKLNLQCKLTLVCREPEYAKLADELKRKIEQSQINIQHISGENLNQLYEKMDFALIPRKRSIYQDFSMPVKLVEYLSNGLPIVVTDCSAQKRFINDNGYGLVCQDEPESMATAIYEMIQSMDKYQKNIQETFLENHSWISRVEKVKTTLVGDQA